MWPINKLPTHSLSLLDETPLLPAHTHSPILHITASGINSKYHLMQSHSSMLKDEVGLSLIHGIHFDPIHFPFNLNEAVIQQIAYGFYYSPAKSMRYNLPDCLDCRSNARRTACEIVRLSREILHHPSKRK